MTQRLALEMRLVLQHWAGTEGKGDGGILGLMNNR